MLHGLLTIAGYAAAMFHDKALAAATTDPRPVSAVGHGIGLAGMVGMIGWCVIARLVGMDGTYAALVKVLACGVPMVRRALVVEKVHRRDSTGSDWKDRRTWREAIGTTPPQRWRKLWVGKEG